PEFPDIVAWYGNSVLDLKYTTDDLIVIWNAAKANDPEARAYVRELYDAALGGSTNPPLPVDLPRPQTSAESVGLQQALDELNLIFGDASIDTIINVYLHPSYQEYD